MEFNLASISLGVPEDIVDSVIVNVNDVEKIRIVPDSEFECFYIPLRVGINIINIAAIKKNSRIDEVTLSIFRRSDLESEYKDPPDGFQKDYFHMKDNSKCESCHNLKPVKSDRKPVNVAAFPTEKIIFDKKALAESSTCYSCHQKLTSYPFIHGPAAVWSCLSCHDPVSEPKYNVRKPYTKVCYSCHIKQKEEREPKKYFHGPVTTGNCTICHNPHASENPLNLIKSIWNLCVSCHVDKGSGEHIVSFFPGADFHPTRGIPDPLRKGRELSCTGCHDPHATDSPKLWRFNMGNGFELCRKCHSR